MKTTDDPKNLLSWTKCFAVPGQRSIIDMIHPETGRSHINGEDLEQIRVRYPTAEIMDFEQHVKSIEDQQDAEPREWKEVTEQRYEDMLNVLPPAAMKSGAFLVGEAYDHHAGTGRPRFACFKSEKGKYYELSAHITFAEFKRIFGETTYCYDE